MLSGPELYGLFLLGLVVPTAWLLAKVWDKRDRPGARWLFLTIVGLAGWSVGWGLSLLVDSPGATIGALNVVLAFVSTAAVGWLLLALEFDGRRRVATRYVVALFALPFAVQLLAWTNPAHHLVWTDATVVDARGVAQMSYGPGFYLHAGYSYLAILVSGLVWTDRIVRFEGIYRKQVAALIAGWLLPVGTSLAFTTGRIPIDYFNPTPIGFLIGAAIWAWGLYRFQLLELVPIARRRALDEMDEAVIVVDEGGTVVDANAAADDLFDLPDEPRGVSVAALLGAYPGVVEAVEERARDAPVVVTREGERRHLSVTVAAVSREGGPGGAVVVVDDVTARKRHERELELLKQVFARVLRHDIGNDLNVIRAHGELLTKQSDDELAEYARTVVRTCDDLLETSEKARAIEKLVDADRDRYEVDLAHAVRSTAEWARDRFPDATIEVDAPSEAPVRSDAQLELAIRCLVENAVVHNDDPVPWVRVTVTAEESETRLCVADDGPGLDPIEQRVFRERTIDPLSHSSGLGLWTVDWVVRNSEGRMDVETSEAGTEVTVILEPSAQRTDPDERLTR